MFRIGLQKELMIFEMSTYHFSCAVRNSLSECSDWWRLVWTWKQRSFSALISILEVSKMICITSCSQGVNGWEICKTLMMWVVLRWCEWNDSTDSVLPSSEQHMCEGKSAALWWTLWLWKHHFALPKLRGWTAGEYQYRTRGEKIHAVLYHLG